MGILAHWRGEVKQRLFSDPTIREALSPHVVEAHCREAGH